MYILRHTRDYEALELPIGASRAEVKAAYRKLAKARRRPPLACVSARLRWRGSLAHAGRTAAPCCVLAGF